MRTFYLTLFAAFITFALHAQDEELIPGALIGSCIEPDSNLIRAFIDYSKNCPEADPTGILAGQDELIVHSGINGWSTVVAWDDEDPVRVKNLGNDVFILEVNTMEVYGTALADIETFHFIPNNGLANPSDAWEAAIRDDQGGGAFGGNCNDFVLTIANLPTCAELAQESSKSLFGATTAANSCIDTAGGNITIEFDLSLNCPEADTANLLAGASALGFHSGANDWAQQVAWDDDGAMNAVNNGNDIFTVTVNAMSYYGIPLDSMTNIRMIMTNGVANPDDAFGSAGRDERDGGFGGAEPCSDLVFILSEAGYCEVEPEVNTSASLLSATGDVSTCADPNTGRVRISFDQSLNCPEADTANLLADQDSLGFHSGANNWAATVAWDDSTALPAVNDGNNVFTVTVDVMEYYGIPFDSLKDIKLIMNYGLVDPAMAWDITGKDERDGGFGGDEPCSDLVFDISEVPTCDLSDPPDIITSPALRSDAAGSCVDHKLGLIRMAFDETLNCPDADTANVLDSALAMGFHSGANDWGSIVAWDDPGAKTMLNEGNQVFSVVVNAQSYYGLPLDSIENVIVLPNNGAENPSEPWAVTGKEEKAGGGFGNDEPCSNMIFVLSEAPSCDLSETATSHALLNGLATSCVDTVNGLIRIDVDYALNCPEADTSLAFLGVPEVGFHSGINNWMNQVPWDDSAALTFQNLSAGRSDNDVFSVTIDPMEYYGTPLAEVEEINFLGRSLDPANDFNDPTLKDARDNVGGFGTNPCSNFRFVLSDAQACDLSTSVKDIVLEQSIKVSPNPFTDEVLIEFDNPDGKEFDLFISDMSGRLVRDIRNINGNQIVIKRENLTPGIYFANLRDRSGYYATAKIMVQ